MKERQCALQQKDMEYIDNSYVPFYVLRDANCQWIKKVDFFDAESEISNDKNN